MSKKLTKDDVWGTHDPDTLQRLTKGMLVSIGLGKMADEDERQEILTMRGIPDICPIWKDTLPYKSVTVICNNDQENEVIGWLEYVHGSECIEKKAYLPEGKVAIRSNYMCW